MSQKLSCISSDLLLSFVKLLELRNPFNIDHCKLVANHCALLASEVGLDTDSTDQLIRAAEVHTLGVLLQMEEKQPDRDLPISNLNGCSGREVSIHKREEEIFRDILGRIPGYENCLDVLMQRHEWFDGTGSILGYSGDKICIEARILAVADAYVDLVTPKAHRPPETNEVALARLRELAGTQFDPSFVEALEKALAKEDQDQNSTRNRKFELAHCRHYLGLGHFYTQIHETEWALRSYIAAERMAERIEDQGLQLGAISGQFMVFCDQKQLERARETLQQVRERGTTSRGKMGYQLLWGLLEWLSGNKLGKEILGRLIEAHETSGNLPGLTAALGFQACMTLFHQGAKDGEHLELLTRFLDVVNTHDVFDVVERYRPYTIPVFLNAVVQDVNSRLARNLLTRMGEPCHGPLQERLKDVHPTQWTSVLMPHTHLSDSNESSEQGQAETCDIRVSTLGELRFESSVKSVGVEGFQTQKVIKLFLRMAMDAGRPVSIESLAEELWPDAGPKKARDSFRNCVHQVRRSIRSILGNENADVVGRSRKNKTVTLELSVGFDSGKFEALVLEALDTFKGGGAEEAQRVAQQALELYKGDFLESFDEGWVEARRARLRSLKMQALTVVAQCQLDLEDFLAAESSSRALLELDDLREQSHAILIECLARSGRSNEAVVHYEKAVELFEDEIGIAPDSLREPLLETGLLL